MTLNRQERLLILAWIRKALDDPYLDGTTLAIIEGLQKKLDKAFDDELNNEA